tara:strand:+ start:688 stop:1383 length:696 start_codon:yes stop_codon:yes gene_type:complete
MAISLDIQNILQFFSFLSPILISTYLIFQSFMEANLKGPMWLIGSLISWAIGIAFKSMFHRIDDNKVNKFIKNNQKVPEGTRTFQRIPVRHNLPLNPGQTKNSTPDYCNVFSGPFSNSALYTTSMPSLNAIFHAFTISYIGSGIAVNPNHPFGGILFLISITILAVINWMFRITLYCDKILDVVVGAVLGIGAGIAWFTAINNINPTWTYYSKEKQGKCVLGTQKFSCTYE